MPNLRVVGVTRARTSVKRALAGVRVRDREVPDVGADGLVLRRASFG